MLHPFVVDLRVGAGDGKHRATLGSDGRLLRVIGIADAAGMWRAAEGARLEIQRGEIRALDPGRRRHQRSVAPAKRVQSIAEVFLPLAVALDQWSRILVFYIEMPRDR